MRTQRPLYDGLPGKTSAGFARIGTGRPTTVAARAAEFEIAARRAAATDQRDALQACVLRSATANGFADAALVPPAEMADRGAASDTPAAGRVAGSPTGATALLAPMRALLRRLGAGWQRRHLAKCTFIALRRLDERALRDLGIDRSELQSVAAEVAGDADSTRARPRWTFRVSR